MGEVIFELKKVSRGFSDGNEAIQVLEEVNLTLYSGEIVGLLGRSGSGKSTLLRIIAGLIIPSSGEVLYQGQPLEGPPEGVSMVFQTFALFPWLTVQQNVEAGLEALGVPAKERQQRALKAIDLIGMDGFENAYPRELSGGMRQRVGFARALVVNPKLLLMDEPFSALDVLTAETLRNDLLELWASEEVPIQSILIVTHNIEEAVYMCDRILVLSSNPGKIVSEIKVNLPHRRNRQSIEFRQRVDAIYSLMTAKRGRYTSDKAPLELGSRLTDVSTNLMAGLLEDIASEPYNGKVDMPEIAEKSHMEVDELFPVADILEHLGFVEVKDGDILLTTTGKLFSSYGTQERKVLFSEHLLRFVPLAARIYKVLQERPDHCAPRLRFIQELEDFLPDEAAEETLNVVISWSRYAEVFYYDDHTEIFTLDDDAEDAAAKA